MTEKGAEMPAKIELDPKERRKRRRWAANLGRLGGLSKSRNKRLAAQKNGKLGGRPRKPKPKPKMSASAA